LKDESEGLETAFGRFILRVKGRSEDLDLDDLSSIGPAKRLEICENPAHIKMVAPSSILEESLRAWYHQPAGGSAQSMRMINNKTLVGGKDKWG
jgi:hypothetical protein